MIHFGQRFRFQKHHFSKRKITAMHPLWPFIYHKIMRVKLTFSFQLLISVSVFLFLFLGSLNTFYVETLVFAFPISFLPHTETSLHIICSLRWAYDPHIPRASTIPTDLSIFTETKLQNSELKGGSDFSYTVWKLGWLLKGHKMRDGAQGSQLLATSFA